MWQDRDAYLNPIKALICVLGLAVTFALVMAGLVGALWAVTEAIRMIF